MRTKQQPFTKIFNFYIFSNIHVALATFCLTKITLLEIGISESKTALFVFCSTLVSYNIIRLIGLSKTKKWFKIWYKANKKGIYIITAIGILCLIYLIFKINLKALLVVIPFGFFTLFYVAPLKNKTLRSISGLKLFLIAISWAGITVLFPLIQNEIILRITDYITFFQRFLFVVVITIPFDIRDLKFDDKELKTLPQQIGIKKSKFVGLLLLLLFFFLAFFKSDLNEDTIKTLLFVITLTAILLIKTAKNQNKYYAAFFVETIPIFWFLLTLLFQNW